MYLRQQRRQLDESRRLLERLEQQQQQQGNGSIPSSFHIHAADSGTLPSMTTPTRHHGASGGGAGGGDMQGHVGPTRVVTAGTQAGAGSGPKLDLSSLYEQCEWRGRGRERRERESTNDKLLFFSLLQYCKPIHHLLKLELLSTSKESHNKAPYTTYKTTKLYKINVFF